MTPRDAGERTRAAILWTIGELTTTHGRPPTIREIGDGLGGKSTGALSYHLSVLRDAGAIEWTPRTARGIRLVGRTPHCAGCATRDTEIERLREALATFIQCMDASA